LFVSTFVPVDVFAFVPAVFVPVLVSVFALVPVRAPLPALVLVFAPSVRQGLPMISSLVLVGRSKSLARCASLSGAVPCPVPGPPTVPFEPVPVFAPGTVLVPVAFEPVVFVPVALVPVVFAPVAFVPVVFVPVVPEFRFVPMVPFVF
jgi:hypothetical protein